MFDIANPQKREQLLVIFAVVVLGFIVINMLPAQFRAVGNLKRARDGLERSIEDRRLLAEDKERIQSRLSAMEQRALASGGTPSASQAEFGYRMWLDNLASNAGLAVTSPTSPPASAGGIRGPHGYLRHTFRITVEGQLGQIAEFLRRFHRTEYLHTIQNVQIRPQSRVGVFSATFAIEALSLPQIELVSMPSTEGIAATADERQLLDSIQNRAILTEYRPPAPTPPPTPTVTPDPPPVFDDIAFCVLEGITLGVDGRLQCWINHRTRGVTYRLVVGQSFMLGGLQCTINRIDIDNQRILVEIDGALFSLRAGQNFDQVEAFQPE